MRLRTNCDEFSSFFCSKKLNFSEDEASTEDDRNGWRPERTKDKRETKDSERNSKTPDSSSSTDRSHGREKTNDERKATTEEKRDRFDRTFDDRKSNEEKKERYDRSYSSSSEPGSVPPRWQQQQQQQQPSRTSYEQRKTASPASGFEEDGWKRREMVEVQAALERARFLEQEEEKRYEEKKRFDQKRGREGREFSESGEAETGDQYPPAREGRGASSSGQDGRDGPWDAHADGGHDKGRDYRGYGDRRDVPPPHREPGFRDQYDRSYDRRDREQQPVFSSTFKSRLPPRFQKQQQQQQQQGPPHRGSSHQPPSLFDSRYSQTSYRHPSRDDSEFFVCLCV